MRVAAALLLFVIAWPAAAQFGQIPMPGSKRTPGPTTQRKETVQEVVIPPVEGVGTVRSIDAKTIVVQAEDSRVLECALTSKTEFHGPDAAATRDDIHTGSRVRIAAKADEDGNLTATSVTIENSTEKPADEKTATIQKAPPPSDDEDAPPVLHRGIPAKRKRPAAEEEEVVEPPAEAKAVAAIAPPPAEKPLVPAHPALLDKARESSLEFTENLPNFVCQQFTTRYEMESKISGWKPLDVVSADVVFVDGKEQYQNLKIGNRKITQAMMDIKGQRSEGEYGSTLKGLFDHATDADFAAAGDARVGTHQAKIFTFSVKHENSDWRILIGGQSIVPAYSGRVWIDRESGRVLRMERQAQNIPEAFPMDDLEQTVDYDFTMLGNRKVLLPSESENLSCQRGTPYCHKNAIQFRNYKQFKGEASINFEVDKAK